MSLDNFKNFVKENPKLANFVRNGDMTWQKFYELYDLYGPFHDIWNKYLGITTNRVFSFKDVIAGIICGIICGFIGLWIL